MVLTTGVRFAAIAIAAAVAGCAAALTTVSRPAPAAAARPVKAAAETGSLAPAAVAAYLDREEADLRARTGGSGIEVVRRGGAIRLELPAALAFGFNSASLRPEIRAALDRVAQTLTSYRATSVDVGGHSDAVGTDAVNQRLSEARAGSVAAYFQAKGVDPRRVGTRGYGKSRPVAANDTDEGRARNRRVEIDLVPLVAGGSREP